MGEIYKVGAWLEMDVGTAGVCKEQRNLTILHYTSRRVPLMYRSLYMFEWYDFRYLEHSFNLNS